MAGIYIHIPFCKQACHYCNFHFSTSLHYKKEVLEAMRVEIRMQKEYLAGETPDTVYFGGGTPSLLDETELTELLKTIRDQYTVTATPEITLEANPDDISLQKLQAWQSAGINRLSIGIQSFFDEDLTWMNRAHQADQAINCLELALPLFPNISIDLIYGTPGLSDARWIKNMETAVSLGIPHLSCYALTVESKTPLDKLIREKKKAATDPDVQAAQFRMGMDYLEAAGYEHYEISNFAKPGFRSRHNKSYWEGKKYLGIGPSAHSYNGNSRQWNVANNQRYLKEISAGTLPAETEQLTPVQKLNEKIMIELRTTEGLDFSGMDEQTKSSLLQKSRTYLERGLMIQEGNRLRLTKEGKLLADGIAGDLFFE